MQRLGWFSVISLLSYTAAVIFSPLAYSGYDWMAQAVSDLSADSAPSRTLWNQLASLYVPCGVVSVTAVCVFIGEKWNKPLRTGLYLFSLMIWVSAVGYAMFPLSAAGTPSGFQNAMHIVVTIAVVLLSISSLILIAVGGFKQKTYPSLATWALGAFLMMLLGAIGTGTVPAAYFGIPERLSVFAATGFNAVLGVYLVRGFKQKTAGGASVQRS